MLIARDANSCMYNLFHAYEIAFIRNNVKFELLRNVYLPSRVEEIGIRVLMADRYINFIVIYRSSVGDRLIVEREWNKMFRQFGGINTFILG